MKIISLVEEKRNFEHWTPKAASPVNSELPGIEGPAVQRWLSAHDRRMPLIMLTQQGKPTVVSDIGGVGARGAIKNQASPGMVEKQIELVCEFWTGWCARVR